MKHTYHLKMRAVFWAMLVGVLFSPVSNALAWCTGNGAWCCQCPGQPQDLGSHSSCEEACGLITPNRGNSTPNYDYGAAQRAQEAAAAERAHQQAEAERIERERKAEEKRQKDAAFIRDRDVAAGSLKGSTVGAMNQLKGLSGTDNFGLKGSGFDSVDSVLKGLQGSDYVNQKSIAEPATHTDTSEVDARNVPTGLPTSVDNAIPHTPAGDRVRKGFQAIANHDWTVALAWFQDAHNYEPDSPGIQRLVDLAQFTIHRHKEPALKPTVAVEAPNGKADISPQIETRQELNQSLREYYEYNPPEFVKHAKPGEEVQSDTEWINEKEPLWKNFFRLFTPSFKVQEDGSIINVGIRG